MCWIRRFRPRTQEAEHPGSPDADLAPTRVVTATAGDRPRVSALPVTVTTPAAAPVPISGPVPVSVPASLPTAGAEVKSPKTAQPEVKLAEPVRPVPPVEPPKTATTPQPQAPVPVATTSGRDAYFRPGGYSPDDRQHAKATPAAAHPVMGGPSLLSLGLPWDELTLTAFAANSSEPSPEHRQAVTDLAARSCRSSRCILTRSSPSLDMPTPRRPVSGPSASTGRDGFHGPAGARCAGASDARGEPGLRHASGQGARARGAQSSRGRAGDQAELSGRAPRPVDRAAFHAVFGVAEDTRAARRSTRGPSASPPA